MEGRAARRGRAAEDLAEYRIAVGAEAIAGARRLVDRLGRLGRHHRGDVVPVVEARELIGRRDRAVDIDVVGQPVERAAEVDRRRDARNGQRVLPAIARAPVDVAADEAGPVEHGRMSTRPVEMPVPVGPFRGRPSTGPLQDSGRRARLP